MIQVYYIKRIPPDSTDINFRIHVDYSSTVFERTFKIRRKKFPYNKIKITGRINKYLIPNFQVIHTVGSTDFIMNPFTFKIMKKNLEYKGENR